MSNIPMNDLVALYLELRKEKAKINAATKEKLAVVNKKMSDIESYFLRVSDKLGVDSFKTPAGTAYIATRTFANVKDWDALLDFIVDNECFDFLTRKVSSPAVRAYIDEHDVTPPGVDMTGIKTVGVRVAPPS